MLVLKLLEILFNVIYIFFIMSFFLGSIKRDLSDKSRDEEDSKKVKESDSASSLQDVDFPGDLNSLELAKLLTCKLFKNYREPSKGAFHFPRRGKKIPN